MGDRQDTSSRSGRCRCTTTGDRWTRTSNITGESGPRRMRMRSTYTDSRTHDVLSSLPGTARMATRSPACRPVPGLPATDGPARTRRGIREGANSKLGIQRTGAGDTLYTTRVRQRGVINIHAELDDSNTWRACDGTPGATSTTQGCRYGRALLLGVLGKLQRGDKPGASVGGLRMMSLQDRLKHVTPTAYGVRINMLRRSGMRVDDMLEDGQQEFHNGQAVKGERPQIQHSATGQDESWWQCWSWDAPSATGQDESWDDSHQQSWSSMAASWTRAGGAPCPLSNCTTRGNGAILTRQELGIAWRADSRMARAAAWRAGRY